jgi:hypothetical protein
MVSIVGGVAAAATRALKGKMKPMEGASASSPATVRMATTDSSVEQGLEASCSRTGTARQVLWQRRSRTVVEDRAKLVRRPGVTP